jgi:hypothetical protein
MTTPCKIEDGTLVVRMFGGTPQVKPHGPDALYTRARPGLTVAAPHVGARLGPLPSQARIAIAATSASITNGD